MIQPESAFVDDRLYEKFKEELFSWLGTPYKHFTMVKQRGADCALFVMACFRDTGILSYVNNKDYYPKDWWRHGGGEVIKDKFVDHMTQYAEQNFASVWLSKQSIDEIYRGDLLAFSMSKTGISHHCGIILEGNKEMIHSINGRGVMKVPYAPWWERHRTGIIRIIRGRSNGI